MTQGMNINDVLRKLENDMVKYGKPTIIFQGENDVNIVYRGAEFGEFIINLGHLEQGKIINVYNLEEFRIITNVPLYSSVYKGKSLFATEKSKVGVIVEGRVVNMHYIGCDHSQYGQVIQCIESTLVKPDIVYKNGGNHMWF